MIDPSVDALAETIARAEALGRSGDPRGQIELLTAENRLAREPRLEVALVEARLRACNGKTRTPDEGTKLEAIAPIGDGDEIVEVGPEDATVAALQEGLARSGCLLVRGLIPPDRGAELISGIDAALAAFDASEAGESCDPAWYTPRHIRDRIGHGVALNRDNRSMGALWTVFSPRMLFLLLDAVEALGVGRLITEFLGEQPFLSANKCTLRRVPPADLYTGWHQDGAFLGDSIGSLNLWMSLTPCGTDSPGLDLVPKRFDRVLKSGGDGAIFKWSLSEQAVSAAAGSTSVVRPEFGAGDALLFDHRLVHRTASSSAMTHDRYAIESWFFAPSAYPDYQVPLFV